jgi:hypothetical protein
MSGLSNVVKLVPDVLSNPEKSATNTKADPTPKRELVKHTRIGVQQDNFLSPLTVNIDHTAGRYFARILLPFTYQLNVDEYIRVPVNMQTDFTSIPNWARYFYSPMGRWAKAAVVHDYLYAGGWIRLIATNEVYRRPLKQEADEIFRLAMLRLGVTERNAKIMYRAVSMAKMGHWHTPTSDLYIGET